MATPPSPPSPSSSNPLVSRSNSVSSEESVLQPSSLPSPSSHIRRGRNIAENFPDGVNGAIYGASIALEEIEEQERSPSASIALEEMQESAPPSESDVEFEIRNPLDRLMVIRGNVAIPFFTYIEHSKILEEDIANLRNHYLQLYEKLLEEMPENGGKIATLGLTSGVVVYENGETKTLNIDDESDPINLLYTETVNLFKEILEKGKIDIQRPDRHSNQSIGPINGMQTQFKSEIIRGTEYLKNRKEMEKVIDKIPSSLEQLRGSKKIPGLQRNAIYDPKESLLDKKEFKWIIDITNNLKENLQRIEREEEEKLQREQNAQAKERMQQNIRSIQNAQKELEHVDYYALVKTMDLLMGDKPDVVDRESLLGKTIHHTPKDSLQRLERMEKSFHQVQQRLEKDFDASQTLFEEELGKPSPLTVYAAHIATLANIDENILQTNATTKTFLDNKKVPSTALSIEKLFMYGFFLKQIFEQQPPARARGFEEAMLPITQLLEQKELGAFGEVFSKEAGTFIHAFRVVEAI